MMSVKNLRYLCIAVVTGAILGGCGEKPSVPDVAQVKLSAELEGVYQTSCAVCHGTAGTGAPQTGVAEDWQGRIDAGMDAVLNKAMNGYQGMPAMGGCFHCSEDDFRQLIGFMTNGRLR